MKTRLIDKRIGLVSVNENGKDKDYRLYAGKFEVSYTLDRKNAQGRPIRMHRTLDPNSAKADKIRAILGTAQ